MRLMVNADCPLLVSCITPTYNRRRFLPRTIKQFLAQDYPYRELIILDDGDDSVADLIPRDERIRYVRLDFRLSIGAKRNQCVQLAQGKFIMHWDDDDWMAPWRIRYQVQELLTAKAAVCGLRKMLFYDVHGQQSWLYEYPEGPQLFLIGGSLLYTREFWSRAPFPEITEGEDTRFIIGRRPEEALVLADHSFYVALIHEHNTSPKRCAGSYWSRWHGDIRSIVGDAAAVMPQGDGGATAGQTTTARTLEPESPMKLNLGCCDNVLPGFVNVDIVPGPDVDVVADLRQPWPWSESAVTEIRATDIIEHLPDKIHTMNELWRVLRPGGVVEIGVPTTDGPGAFQDPTHVSFWNRRSFLYCEEGNPYRERFARSYGISARFRIVTESTVSTPDGPYLKIILEAVKDAQPQRSVQKTELQPGSTQQKQHMLAPSFHVVILSANASNLIACVGALRACEPDLSAKHIIVVDDGARTEAEPVLPGIRWVQGAKPFVFARNANLGIQAADGDVILLNDDALLRTPLGFTELAEQHARHPTLGLCSPGINDAVGNPRQVAVAGGGFALEPQQLCFVCVYIPRSVYAQIGLLDERFVGYGYEDDDYCRRVLASGRELGIFHGCVVDHGRALPSSFRTRRDIDELFAANRRVFQTKWQGWEQGKPVPPTWPSTSQRRDSQQEVTAPRRTGSGGRPWSEQRCVDFLYLAWNRLEFTRESFTQLITNTDWDLVHELFVIDDGSEDGTAEWLESQLGRIPTRVRLLRTKFGSPVTAMVHFIQLATAPILAKSDNDAVFPPGWLRHSLAVFDRHPELDMLGLEAINTPSDKPEINYTYTPSDYISGLGLYRRDAFVSGCPESFDKYYGLEEWQMAQGEKLVRGWISPGLPVFLLDRLPIQPWRKLSDSYIERGWQRPWEGYSTDSPLWSWRWPTEIRLVVDAPGPVSGGRIVCALVVRGEGDCLDATISSVLPLCHRVMLLDASRTGRLGEVCQHFGQHVGIIRSPFTGIDESRDKNYLLDRIRELPCEWVLWLQDEEVLTHGACPMIARAIASRTDVAAYSLRVAFLWDREDQIRVDGIFGRFSRPTLFRLKSYESLQLHFLSTGRGGNLHCGNVPSNLAGQRQALDAFVAYRGYLSDDSRRVKFELYTTLDPDNFQEGNYRHILGMPGALHAPGPIQLAPWPNPQSHGPSRHVGQTEELTSSRATALL